MQANKHEKTRWLKGRNTEPHMMSEDTPYNNGFYDFIKNNWDENTYSLVKDYTKKIVSLANFTTRRVFLLKHRSARKTPKFILDKASSFDPLKNFNHPFYKDVNKFEGEFYKKFLDLEIKICDWLVHNTEKSTELIRSDLSRALPTDIFDFFMISQQQKLSNIKNKNSERLDKKFNRNVNIDQEKPDFWIDEKCFHNLTDIEVPEMSKILFCLGPQFALPVDNNNLPLLRLLADVDYNTSFLCKEETTDTINTNVSENIHSFIKCKGAKKNKINNFLDTALAVTRKFLKENKEIYVTNSDKSKMTVLLPKSSYEEKMAQLLSDETTYEKIDFDPTEKLIKENTKLVNKLNKDKLISNNIKLRLRNESAIAPRVYGLPKIHKENAPLRPIVSTINSPAGPLAKFCAQILNNITDKDKYNFGNSYNFKKFVDKIVLPKDYVLVSFDVVSLFTNVPLDLAKKVIEEKSQSLEDVTPIYTKDFVDLIAFCVDKNNYFTYQKSVYKQKEGLAMGNSLSPVLSDLVMEKLFDTQIPLLNYTPIFVKKYVDDVITAIPKDRINETLDILNSFHPKIQFTMECEKKRRINFLDMTLIRTKEQKIITDWYSKPTSSNRLLNFLSAHPYVMKTNVASSFVNRMFTLSDRRFHSQNEKRIYNLLGKNNYPEKLINTLIRKARYAIYNTERNNDELLETQKSIKERKNAMVEGIATAQPRQFYASIQYIPKLSESIKKHITKDNSNIKISFKPPHKLNCLFTNLKDPIPKQHQNNVVYDIPCKSPTCGMKYIGTTGKRAETRVQQHKNDVRLKRKELDKLKQQQINNNKNTLEIETELTDFKENSGYKTALVKHCIQKGHSFDFENFCIIDTEKHHRKREKLESYHIKLNQQSAVNYRVNTNNIDKNYSEILSTYKTQTQNKNLDKNKYKYRNEELRRNNTSHNHS